MEQAINLLDQLSQKIATLTTKKIPKISFSKNDNEWRTFISQSKPHWEDISWRVKVPNESGESEVHLGFYSAKTSDLLNSAIIDVTNEFQSKTDNIIKNENGIRLVWNVNVNDPASIDKLVTAINDISTNFFMHAQKVLFEGKEKTSFEASVVTTETVNNTAPKNHIETYTFDNGDHYEGYRKESLPHGYGKMTYADGGVYEGEWSEGLKHGQGKMTCANGVVYEGEWSRGQQHGQGKKTYAKGGVYEGEWLVDNRHGQGKMTYADGDVYEGEWFVDNWHGQGKMTYADGSVYEGDWKDGEKQGIGKMTYGEDNLEGADSYDGEWKIDWRHGLGKMIYKDTLWNLSDYSVYEGEWNDDSHHFGKMNYVNGDVYEGYWSILGSEGNGKMTYANGDVYDGNWSEGSRHGQGKMTYANKDWYSGDWDKGMRHGEAISLINGEAIMLWENDEPKIEIKWDTYTWDNGNHYEGYWKGKHPHGEGKKTYADGEWREGEFEEGTFISGKGKIIYEGGDYYEGELKGSQRHGRGNYHNSSGGVWWGNWYEDSHHGRQVWDSDGDGFGYAMEYVYGERKYKEGSVVQLKSGGPKMNVTDVSNSTITCNWISYGKNKSFDYDEDVLNLIE